MMKETIDLLGKILTNILTALYEPFGFSLLLSFLAMFFYLYPTDIRDVRKVLSIDELMDELRKFDNEKLYPYVVGLIEKLKIAVSPSPMII